MSMHLHHPSLSLNGKKKGQQKFRNADEAKRARELDASWSQIQKRWGVEAEERKQKRAFTAPAYVPPKMSSRGADLLNKPSLNTGAGIAARVEDKVYTGTAVVGISTLHKSNGVPVFSKEEAVDISRMRR
jgi:hypothetical protein